MKHSTEEFLEIVAGERCPCGHLASAHEEPGGPGVPLDGFTEKIGACLQCDCKGVIEMLDDD